MRTTGDIVENRKMIELIQGDCLEKMDELIKRGVKVDAIITDPPYGTTSCAWDSIIPFEEMWAQINRVIKDNGAICLFAIEPFASHLRISNEKLYKYDWYWEKSLYSNVFNVKKQPKKIIENICVFYKKQPTYNPQMEQGKPYTDKGNRKVKDFSQQQIMGVHTKTPIVNNGTRYPKNIIQFSNPNNNKVHPTQKPVALLEYLIKTYTNAGETVLDFTMGSGSTGVACVNTGRDFIGIELDENYYKIAEKRIQEAQQLGQIWII